MPVYLLSSLGRYMVSTTLSILLFESERDNEAESGYVSVASSYPSIRYVAATHRKVGVAEHVLHLEQIYELDALDLGYEERKDKHRFPLYQQRDRLFLEEVCGVDKDGQLSSSQVRGRCNRAHFAKLAHFVVHVFRGSDDAEMADKLYLGTRVPICGSARFGLHKFHAAEELQDALTPCKAKFRHSPLGMSHKARFCFSHAD